MADGVDLRDFTLAEQKRHEARKVACIHDVLHHWRNERELLGRKAGL